MARSGRSALFAGGLREPAPGTFAWLHPNGAWGEANAGLVVGDGESLLIDTLWDERLARAMLAAMAPHTEKAPIRTVLNTHSDGDHWWGNATVPADARIITSAPSRAAMDAEAPPASLARIAALARHAPGATARYLADMLGPFHFAGITPRLPDEAFGGSRATLSVGGREVVLHVLGPAHTPGDTIAHVPDARTVFAADLLFNRCIPVMWHGPSANWQQALEVMLELDADVYVPGHGDVAGRAEVQALQDFWTWLRAATEHDDDPVAATRRLLRSDAFAPYADWECPERLLITVAALIREHAGRPPLKVTPAVRARLFRDVARVQKTLVARTRI